MVFATAFPLALYSLGLPKRLTYEQSKTGRKSLVVPISQRDAYADLAGLVRFFKGLSLLRYPRHVTSVNAKHPKSVQLFLYRHP